MLRYFFSNKFNNNIINKISLKKIANDISELLAKYPKTMIQYSPEQIETFMKKNPNTFSLLFHDEELIGFARFLKWDGYNKENNKKVYEFGSWIIKKNFAHKGYGKIILKKSIRDFQKYFNNIQIIAVVGETNILSKNILIKYGAKEIKKPSNVTQLLSNKSYFLDLSNLNF